MSRVLGDLAPRQAVTAAAVAAAAEVADVIAVLAPVGAAVDVVQRGEHDWWDELHRLLVDAGMRVRRRRLADADRTWALPGADGGGDLLVHHDPFAAVGATVDVDAVRTAGRPVVFVDFPHGLRSPELKQQLEDLYLRALGEPWWVTETRSRALAALLEQASVLRLRRGARLLTVRGPWEVRSDLSSFHLDVPVLQLPMGESWVACSPHAVHGDLELLVSTTTTTTMTLRGGVPVTPVGEVAPAEGDARTALLDRWPPGGGVVEVGLGTNTAAAHVTGTSLAEKSWGTVHVGLGDNTLLGGEHLGTDHWDIGLPTDVEVTAEVGGTELRVCGVGAARQEWVVLLEASSGQAQLLASSRSRAVASAASGTTDTTVTGLVGGCIPGPDSLLGHRLVDADSVVHVLGAPPVDDASTNLAALATAGTLRVRDVVVLPAPGGDRTVPLATFGRDVADGLAAEPELGAAWDLLTNSLGPLPWDRVRVVVDPRAWPRGLSFPGLVVLSESLLDAPLTLRWLYLLHELVHQWLGNLVPVEDPALPAAELLVDALAVGLGIEVLGPTSRHVYQDLARRYHGSDDVSLRSRGEVLAICASWDGPADVLRESVATACADSRRSLRRTGRRRPVGPAVLHPLLEKAVSC